MFISRSTIQKTRRESFANEDYFYQPLKALRTKVSCQLEFFLVLFLSYCLVPLIACSECDLSYSRGGV